MTIDSIHNGLVIDHIASGKAMQIYEMLNLGSLGCPVAMMMNVHSVKMGKKDIIKIDGEIDIDLEVIGYVSPNSTINVIKDGKRVSKSHVSPPEKLIDIIKCRNPRCITTTERDIPHIFMLSGREKCEYRCMYCEGMAR